MNYAKCLELDELLVAKGKAPKGNCDSKRTASLEKATAKFVTKLDVNDVACGIDTETAAGDQALQWLASGDGSLTPAQEAALAGTAADITSDNAALCTDAGGTYDAGTDTCSVDITSDNASLCTDAGGTYDAGADTCSVDITSDNAAAEQAGCVAAGGTYESSVCTPAPVPDRDCFREGACAYEGFNYGVYYNMYSSSRPTGCIKRPDAGPISADSYNDGVEAASPNRYSNITPWGVTVAWFCSQNVLAVPGTGQCAIGCD
jgi:hypothetical protein